jgi:hypothetical protein
MSKTQHIVFGKTTTYNILFRGQKTLAKKIFLEISTGNE